MMTTNNKHIDQLTRKLMQDSVEQPSSSLMGKIMEQVMQAKEEEKEIARKPYTFRNILSLKNIFGCLVIYAIIALSALYFIKNGLGSLSAPSPLLIEMFPIVFTGLAVIAFLFLFSQLDNWLWQKEEHKK